VRGHDEDAVVRVTAVDGPVECALVAAAREQALLVRVRARARVRARFRGRARVRARARVRFRGRGRGRVRGPPRSRRTHRAPRRTSRCAARLSQR